MRINLELEKRKISIDIFRRYEAYCISKLLKEDWKIKTIAKKLLNGSFNYLNLPNNEFLKKVEELYKMHGEWLYTTYLDELEQWIREK